MKKTIIILTLLNFTLTACGASSGTQTGLQKGGTLPAITQLTIGTLKLEDTNHAVTKEQAAELLPLWQVYQQLSTSDTAAQAEIDGLAEQIQDTMTADQRKAIIGMKLSQEDVLALMQEQGTDMGAGSSPRGSNSSGQSRSSGFPGGGDPGGGMPPSGGVMPDPGGGMPGQGSSSQTPNSTAGAAQQPGGGGMDRIPPALLNALIQYLQKKAGS